MITITDDPDDGNNSGDFVQTRENESITEPDATNVAGDLDGGHLVCTFALFAHLPHTEPPT